MDAAVAFHFRDAGYLRNIQKVITHGGVIYVSRQTQRFCNGMGNQSPQTGCVLRNVRTCHSGTELFVYLVAAALQFRHHASTADYCRKITHIVILRFEEIHHSFRSVNPLCGNIREVVNPVFIMNDVGFEHNLSGFVGINRNLRRG